MKSIVIYYSRTGNTTFIAEEIATNLGSDILPLADKKNRRGFLNWFIAGYDALKQNKTEIEPVNFNADKYGLIFIGCPNWAAQMPPALRTFLDSVDLADRKVVLFCTQDGSGAEKVFNNLRRSAKSADVLAERYFNKVLKNKDNVRQEVRDWLKQFKTNK